VATTLKHVIVMDRMFDLLLERLQELLYDLNMGKTASIQEVDEMWTLLHHLHFASYDSNSGDLLNELIEYYG
jgi:hypothetical protein